MSIITCIAPVNIAVIKYCKFINLNMRVVMNSVGSINPSLILTKLSYADLGLFFYYECQLKQI